MRSAVPRRSIKEERRAQILDAFEICVARYGVEGATLERVAEEAGLARPLIRHNVGNRDDLLDALLERYLESSEHSMRELVAALPQDKRLETLIDWLFDPAMIDHREVLVSNALIAAAAERPKLARAMRDWTRAFIADIAQVVAEAHPEAEQDAVEAVAAGIAAAYLSVESMAPLGPMTDLRRASKAAAQRLGGTLEG